MNKVVLSGRISKDIFMYNKERHFAIMTIAVAKNYNKEETDFIPILIGGTQAKDLNKRYFKGDLVCIQASVTTFMKDGKQTLGLAGEVIEYLAPGKIHKALNEKKKNEG